MELKKEIKKTTKQFTDLGDQLLFISGYKNEIKEGGYQKEIRRLAIAANAFMEIYRYFVQCKKSPAVGIYLPKETK